MEAKYVFWTGGFDSTFRVLWLNLVCREIVQPLYLIDLTRTTWTIEISTINLLSNIIRKKEECSNRLKPILIFDKDDFVIEEDIEMLYQSILKKAHIGTQYKWLAQFCRNMNYGIGAVELCIMRHEVGATGLQSLIFKDPENGCFDLNDNDAGKLFRFFSFPLMDVSKRQMQKLATENQLSDILSKTWFCHEPIFGKPCGSCRPCQIALEELPETVVFSKVSSFISLYKRCKQSKLLQVIRSKILS